MLFQYSAICALLYPFLFSKWHMWYGGWSFGYRIMTEVSFFLCFVMIPIIPVIRQNKLKMAFFVLMILVSCIIQLIGAFGYIIMTGMVETMFTLKSMGISTIFGHGTTTKLLFILSMVFFRGED